jgi:hypothetical protein
MYVDLVQMKVKSMRGNLYALVVCTPFGWTRVFPLTKKSDAHEGLDLLHRQVGVPNRMIADGGGAFMKEFAAKARRAGSLLVYTDPGTPRHNLAEGAIRELKRSYRRLMNRVESPGRLWDDCFELLALQRNHTALSIYSLSGQVPETALCWNTCVVLTLIRDSISIFLSRHFTHDLLQSFHRSLLPSPLLHRLEARGLEVHSTHRLH